MDRSEYSDILDGSPLAVKPVPAGYSFFTKVSFALVVLLAAYIVFLRLWQQFLRYREQGYRKSMRRKYGIPDSDSRPFNVAHAAVVRARQERDREAARRHFEQTLSEQRQATAAVRTSAARTEYRANSTLSSISPSKRIPGTYGNRAAILTTGTDHYRTSTPLPSPQASRVTFAHASNGHAVQASEQPADTAGTSRRSGRRSIGILKPSTKRTLDDEDQWDQSDHLKKSKVEGEELIDGDEEAAWYTQPSISSTSRGSKRGLSDDVEQRHLRATEKRIRRTSSDDTTLSDENMNVDELEDEVLAHTRSSRGKKRDRVEAGSTFGGDDEDAQVEVETSRQTKRRNKRKSDAGLARGKKRDRDIDRDDDQPQTSLKGSRSKRGKKNSATPDDGSDVSMQDAPRRPREIGDEWESNGVKYKLGLNGQRLRLELLRKSRQRFNMPEDSIHPDREANLDIYVETWLTEEEYQEAKSQFRLSYQATPKASAEPEAPIAKPHSPVKQTGKRLLWDATAAPVTPQPLNDNPFESPRKTKPLITQGLGLDVSLSRSSSRRIASPANSPGPVALYDSTNGSRLQRLSKWEKQDLEAKAMLKLREGNRKKEEEKQKLEKEKAEKEKASISIPAISITPAGGSAPSNPLLATTAAKPTDKPPTAALFPSASPAASGTTSPFPSLTPTTAVKATEAPKPASGFPFPSPSVTPAAPTPAVPSTKPSGPIGLGFPPLPGAGNPKPQSSPFGSTPTLSIAPDATKSAFADAATEQARPNLPAQQPAFKSFPHTTPAPSPFAASTSAAASNEVTKSPSFASSATAAKPSPFAPTHTPAAGVNPPKFNFGFDTTAAPKPNPPASTPSSLSGALNPPAPVASSPFIFNPTPPATVTPPAPTPAPAPAPALAASGAKFAFDFGIAPKPKELVNKLPVPEPPKPMFAAPANTPNPFSRPSEVAAPTPLAQPTTTSNPFVVPSAAANMLSPFAKPVEPSGIFGKATSTNTAPNPFGSSSEGNSTPSSFGQPAGAGHIFGKPAETSSTPNPFGKPVETNVPAKPAFTPAFSFGNAPGGTTPGPFTPKDSAPKTADSSTPAKSAFSFAPTSTPAGSPAQSNPFGGAGQPISPPNPFAAAKSNATPAPNPFGPAKSTFGASSVFGAPAAAGSTTPGGSPFGKPSEAPKTLFSFGGAATQASTTPQATPFGGPSTSTTPSIFGGSK